MASNNVGTFITAVPQPGYMQYDATDRDVADSSLWGMANQPADKFGPTGGELFLVRYDNACRSAATAFPWSGSPNPSDATPRWHYNRILGWSWS